MKCTVEIEFWDLDEEYLGEFEHRLKEMKEDLGIEFNQGFYYEQDDV